MPDMKGAKANEHDARKEEKRIEDLENLYSMLPDVDPEVVEIHYEQFDRDTEKTYEYLNLKFNGIQGLMGPGVLGPGMMGGGIFAITPGTDADDYALNDLVNGAPMLNVALRPRVSNDQLQLMRSTLPDEEKEMINKALLDERKKNIKKVKEAKKTKW